MRHGSLRFTLPIVLLALAAMRSDAQVMRGADALSYGAAADSQRVLADLDQHVRANPRDAGAWYRRGMVAWALAVRGRADNAPKGLDPTKLGRLADTSLRIAQRLDPGNVHYRLSVGRFLLSSGVAMSRAGAAAFFSTALDSARTQGSPRLHAEAAVEHGLVFWRRYEALANRRLVTSVGDIGRSLSDAMNPVAKGAWILEDIAARELADEAVRSLMERSGRGAMLAGGSASITGAQSLQTDVAQAGGLLQRSAASADAAQQTAEQAAALRQAQITGGALAGALTDGQDKQGLRLTNSSLKAIRDLIESHSQPLPPSVTGANDFVRADSLFAEAYETDPLAPSAFRLSAMTRAEKERWKDLEDFSRAHVRAHAKDGLAWMSLGLALHRQGLTKDAYAVFDTGLAALDYDERTRLDDMARLIGPARARRLNRDDPDAFDVFAKMYWMTFDRMWTDGGNETRTEFLARVTYAELRWTVEELGYRGADTDRGDVHVRYGPPDLVAVIGPRIGESAADVMTFWMYRSGLMFAFTSMSGFSTARIPNDDRALVAEMKEAQPARFDNLGAARPDSMLVQLARFRADGDSIDVVIAAAPPVQKIRESMTVSGPVRADVWLVAPTATVAYRDSLTLDSAGVRAWTPRVKPGSYLFRVEASGQNATRAARSSTLAELGSGFSLKGTGVSDVLIANAVDTVVRAPGRWRDLAVTPTVGTVAAGARIALVWENYDFGARNGSAEYETTITIVRQRSATGAIAAKVVGALAAIARVDTKSDRSVISFTRVAQHAPAIADYVNIDLGETPTGTYAVTLSVRDQATGQTYSRSATLTIAK